ncbi:TolB family protein [Streptomyces collinus]|uniref:TolB family protein n=1 Tax=Streptomyces collinus TaxID=42684 RepID=UPI00382483B4
MLTIVLVLLAAGCRFTGGASGDSGSSHDTLAVVAGSRVYLWSADTGRARRIGPPPPQSETAPRLSALTWSADGRKIAWVVTADRGTQIVEVRLTGAKPQSNAWPVDLAPDALVVDGKGVVAAGSDGHLTRYPLNGSVSQSLITTGAATPVPFARGFLLAHYEDSTSPITIDRTGIDGLARPFTRLPATTSMSAYSTYAADARGERLAAERGDHTDVCGIGPPSALYTVAKKDQPPLRRPLPGGPRTLWRLRDLVYGADGTLDVVGFDTGPVCRPPAQDAAIHSPVKLPSTLFELSPNGRISAVAQHVISAQRGPHGQLATISGDMACTLDQGGNPATTTVGAARVEIDHKRVTLPAAPSALRWAPKQGSHELGDTS